MTKPILHTIREILKFKDDTTISEIASMAGLPRRVVLETINRNGQYVWRNRKTGRITKVDPQTPLREQLWESGKFYRKDTYGGWGPEGQCFRFEGNDELKERLQQKVWVGALGDSWQVDVILATEANRIAIEEAGLRPWAEAEIDDRLWKED